MSRSAIVVAVEGLGTNMLGAYGGPWTRTPVLDSFASRAIVADQFLLDSDDLELLYRSLLFGWHAAEKPIDLGTSLPDLLASHGIESLLVHDPSDMLTTAKTAFPVSMEVSREDLIGKEVDDEDWESSWIAECMASALGNWADDEERASLLWIHCKGWNGPWDAPYAYREALGGEDDPPPPRGIDRPEAWFDAESDPDELFGWTQAAAAQAKLLDQAWEWIDATLEELEIGDDSLVILVGLAGYPLGEHNSVGPRLAAPYSERIHTPCIVRFGKRDELGWRIQRPVHPVDLWQTLIDWFDVSSESSPTTLIRRLPRSFLHLMQEEIDQHRLLPNPFLSFTSGGMALRISDWLAVWRGTNWVDLQLKYESLTEIVTTALQRDPNTRLDVNVRATETNVPELYLHPEDRWQQNDVASRAVEVVQAMEQYRATYLRWLEEGQTDLHPPTLPDLFVEQPE